MQNRIEWNDDGTLDEVVTDGGCHLEHMDGKGWFLNCIRADGSSFAVWFDGKITLTEEREPPKRCLMLDEKFEELVEPSRDFTDKEIEAAESVLKPLE